MATQLSPIGDKEVLRCDLCLLVQFPTSTNNCRRCHKSLLLTIPEPESPPPVPVPVPAPTSLEQELSNKIRILRLRAGMSQRKLAKLCGTPRTWISKAENLKCTPVLASLQRIADALNVPMSELVSGIDHNREDDVAELMKDQFIAEIAPFVSRLTEQQRRAITVQVREMVARRAA